MAQPSKDRLKQGILKAHQAGDRKTAEYLALQFKKLYPVGTPALVEKESIRFAEEQQRKRIKNTSNFETFLVKFGSTVDSFVRGIGSTFGLADPKGEFEQNMMTMLAEEKPGASLAGEIAGGVSVGLATGAAAVPLAAKAGIGTLGTAVGTGIFEGAMLAKGGGGSAEEVIAGAALSGFLGAAGERAVTLGIKFFGLVKNRLGEVAESYGKALDDTMFDRQGNLTEAAAQELERFGLSESDLVGDAINQAIRSGEFTNEELMRIASLQKAGVTDPTLAQITRTADSFLAQQEIAKQSSLVRSALEEQNNQIYKMFDAKVRPQRIDTLDEAPGLRDAIVGKASRIKGEVNDIYALARQKTKGQPTIALGKTDKGLNNLLVRPRPDSGGVFEFLTKNMNRDRSAGGVVSGLRGELIKSGAVNKKGNALRAVTSDQAEEIRKAFNTFYDPANRQGNMMLREALKRFDEEVTKQVDNSLYERARKAHADFAKELELDKIDTFDANKKNVLQDILDNKINEDNFVEELITKKSVTSRDLDNALKYVRDETPDAITRFQDEVVDFMEGILFKGPQNQLDQGNVTRAKFDAMLKKIPYEKLEVIFPKEHVDHLRQMERALKIMEPVGGTALGGGPSSAGVTSIVQAVQRRMENSAMAGDVSAIFEFLRRFMDNQKIRKAARQAVDPVASKKAAKQGVKVTADRYAEQTIADKVGAVAAGVGVSTANE